MVILAVLASMLLIRTYENPFDKVCTEDLIHTDMCPMTYQPVCGDNMKTYSNACTACSSKEIERFIGGEC